MRGLKKLGVVLSLVLVLSVFFSSLALADTVHVVQPGEVLWKVAEKYGMDWKTLADYNKLTNPNLIYPNQQLLIPDGESEVVEEVPAPVETVQSDVTVTLLATSDLHGRIYAYEYATDSVDSDAGLAKLQTLIKAENAVNPDAILMDLGDTVQDNSAELFNDLPVHPMVEALNFMGYDTWTIGNHEFNFEKEFVEKNIAGFNGTVLGANIYNEDGTRFVEPYKIFDVNGVRVAVVGLMPPHVPTWEASSPSHFEGLKFESAVEEAKKVVKELEGKYDVLVGAFHLGPDGEHGDGGTTDIAEALPEFDAIFNGHAHSKFADKVVNGVQMIEPGPYGWALSKVDIKVAKDGDSWKVVNVAASNIETAKVAEDPEMLEKFKFVHEQSLANANEVVGQVTAPFVERVDYITGEAIVTTMPTIQIEDSALIDLINEVQLFYTGADISSAAAFKNDMNLVAGDFKKKDVANIYKYDNTLMGVNITGENLKKYMEWSASYYNTAKPGDLTISFNQNVRGYNYDMFTGVDYEIDILEEAGSRIKNLTFNGQPIEDSKIYKLAVNNYRFGTLMSLGLVTDADRYYDSYTVMQDKGRIRDLIVKYIQEEKNGVATPSVDNNWKIVGFDFNNELIPTVNEMIINGEITIPTSEDGRTPNVKAVNMFDLIKDGKLQGYSTLDILHTNDVHGFMLEGAYDGMGYSKLATKVNEVKASNENVLLLDAGDATQGSNLVTLTKGVNAITVLNALGYDAMTAGNHEFDYGKERLKELEEMANFPILSANIKLEDGSDFLTPYVIEEMNGFKVGIFGLTTPSTTFLSHPKNSEGLTFADPIEIAKAMVSELEGKVNVIVALTHLGVQGEVITSVQLAEAVEGIDVIVDGHSHTNLPNGKLVNGTLIAQAHEKSSNLGMVKLVLKDGEVVAKSASLFTKEEAASLEENAEIKAIVEAAQAENKVIEDEVVATSPVLLDGERANVRTGETNLGNLITAAMLDISGADVALMNGGGMRVSIPAGEVTKGQVLSVLPFGNTVQVIEVTGTDIIAALENGLDTYPGQKGAFPHIGGMTVKFDSSKEGGSRVVEVMVGGELLDAAKTYKLVTNDFLAAGGDGYTMLKGKTKVAEFNALDQVLIDFIQANGFEKAVTDGRFEDVSGQVSVIEYEYPLAA